LLVGAASLLTALLIAGTSSAATVTWDFISVLGSTVPYGTGSFSYDSSFGNGPDGITPVTAITATTSLDSFTYTDPVAGTLTLANLGSINFVIGATPTTSGFSFVAQSSNGLRSFTGGVVDANNLGGLSTSVNFGTGQVTNPSLQYPTLAAVPEPSSYALVAAGLALLGLAARRKSR